MLWFDSPKSTLASSRWLTLSQTVNFARIACRYPARIERFLDDLFVDLFPCFNNPLNLQDLNIATITYSRWISELNAISTFLKIRAKFLLEGAATKPIKAALEYKPPLIISSIFPLMKMIAAASIQENTVVIMKLIWCSSWLPTLELRSKFSAWLYIWKLSVKVVASGSTLN